MKNDMSIINKLFEAAHEANVIHRPTGLFFRRTSADRWTLTFVSETDDKPGTPHATGSSPGDAVDNLRRDLARKLGVMASNAASAALAKQTIIDSLKEEDKP